MKSEKTLRSIAHNIQRQAPQAAEIDEGISVCAYVSREFGVELTVAEGGLVRELLDRRPKVPVKEQERLDAIKELRELVKPGDTLYTILRHVSQSGMSRRISVYTEDLRMIDYLVAKATGFKLSNKEGLMVGGCGMDMGFHVVHSVSDVLYGGYGRSETSTGYKCLGEHGRCPSNYHANHRDTINCEGVPQYVVYCLDNGRMQEATSQRFGTREAAEKYAAIIAPDRKAEVEADYIRCWQSGTLRVKIKFPEMGEEDEGIDGHHAFVIERDGKQEICPVCKGEGRVPNPEGPERWDLIHTDGYAIRQRWL